MSGAASGLLYAHQPRGQAFRKTVVDNDLFLFELRRAKRNAAAVGIQNPQYILAASDLGSIHRNILNELSGKYGLEFRFDKYNRFFSVWGAGVLFGHSKINDLGGFAA